jgi:5-methylcytosine-specific restriction protein A
MHAVISASNRVPTVKGLCRLVFAQGILQSASEDRNHLEFKGERNRHKMTTPAATLWSSIQGILTENTWTPLQDIYAHVKGDVTFDLDDEQPEVGDAEQPAWKRNIRNVLQSRSKKSVERNQVGKGEYRLRQTSVSFETGKTYKRRTGLHAQYGGQRQGGISTPGSYPVIFLFTGESGEQYGYADGWDANGVFIFTGEGQRGNMHFVRGNLAIRDHARDGRTLHLFESLGKNKDYRYLGEFVCATCEARKRFDVDGKERSTLVFHLVPLTAAEEVQDEEPTATSPLEELRIAAVLAASAAVVADKTDAKRIVYERSKAVRRYVLARS